VTSGFAVLAQRIERPLFARRPLILGAFLLLTLAMAWQASNLRIDAGFLKLVPLEHEYMETFLKHRDDFGGANRIAIAVIARDGNIFDESYLAALEGVTDAVFFLPGVDRPQVRSLFTPNVRFLETVEDGLISGNVLAHDFQPTPEGFAGLRDNILKAGLVGRLVADDFSGALVTATLLDVNPATGDRLDYRDVHRQLRDIRARFGSEDGPAIVHIIGFAQLAGEIADGAGRVVLFFAFTVLLTALLLHMHTRSLALTLAPVASALTAMVWQLGSLVTLGYGIDPLSILVPFLVFAIGVSHGVQMVGAMRAELAQGAAPEAAARAGFRRILLPGIVALASDTAGFISISWIEVPVIQEIAAAASLGVAAIILTNLILLPVALSCLPPGRSAGPQASTPNAWLQSLWTFLAEFTQPRRSLVAIGCSALLVGASLPFALALKIGDQQDGAPELRPDSTYNRDVAAIVDRFDVGVDVLTLFAETRPDACIEHDVMHALDRVAWQMGNVAGVESVAAMSEAVRAVAAGLKEGSLKWRSLPRDPYVLAQAGAYVQPSSGLLNADCSVMPVYVYTTDHRSDTIERVVTAAESFSAENANDEIDFRLAGGNVGVMAATNEEVAAAQFPILGYVYGAVILLCLLFFRSAAATLCIVLPLAAVSILAYALMTLLGIGLRISTLPVVALGVGIGVDYGIYIYGRLRLHMAAGLNLRDAYRKTLETAGSAVIVTGLTLAVGVASWMFAPLKLQADMGAVLTFMFLVNMIGAVILLPAMAAWLLRDRAADAAG